MQGPGWDSVLTAVKELSMRGTEGRCKRGEKQAEEGLLERRASTKAHSGPDWHPASGGGQDVGQTLPPPPGTTQPAVRAFPLLDVSWEPAEF